MKNIFSIDLESWVHFYIDALKNDPKKFTSLDKRILDNYYIVETVEQLLRMLEKYHQKTTFFIVAEIYDWYPDVIEKIEKAGHEIGYHTHSHPFLKDASILKSELAKSAKFIDRFHPVGFRAPQIHITREMMPILKEKGFKYSSSTYNYHVLDNVDGIDEIPVSTISLKKKVSSNTNLPKNLTIRMLFQSVPVGSGLFVAILGGKTTYFINKMNKNHIPFIFFIHPWQMYKVSDINDLSFMSGILKRNPLCLPYMINISKSVVNLMQNYQFTSFKDYYEY